MNLQIELIGARLRAPFVSSRGSVDVRELLLVRLEGPDGQIGFGEAAPLPSYDGVRVQDVRAALEDCREVLAGTDGSSRVDVLTACANAAVLPQAVAAIDLALWDLAGRQAGEPVWRLLRAPAGRAVEVNCTIASSDRAGAASEAAHARSTGFRCIKAKVGTGDDAGRLAAVRAAGGRQMAIRIDANGVWSVDEALAALGALEPVGIELCEEPVTGLEAIAQVYSSAGIPIAVDESASDPAVFTRRACDAVCLKIARSGGISGVIDAAQRARAAGYEVYLASTLDGPLGIAAALHAAAAVGPDRPCGLATLSLFDGRDDPLPALDGRIALPSGAGLGDDLMQWYG